MSKRPTVTVEEDFKLNRFYWDEAQNDAKTNPEHLHELIPVHDRAKSFYKKAHIGFFKSDLLKTYCNYLISYESCVAILAETSPRVVGIREDVNGFLTQTTMRHIREFLQQYYYKIGPKQFMIENYADCMTGSDRYSL
jgi:hypothetical protein